MVSFTFEKAFYNKEKINLIDLDLDFRLSINR